MPFVPESLRLTEGGADTPYHWSMTEPLSWAGTFRGNIGRLLVPASEAAPFTTDLASVPRVLTWLFPRYGKYTKAAVLHDYLCQTIGTETIELFPARPGDAEQEGEGTRLIELDDRSDADEVFRLVMTELGVPWARRWLMWSAVSWATLVTSLWPGRASKDALRWIGRVVAVVGAVAVVVAGVLAASVIGWLVAPIAIGAVVMTGGYVALGRWDRGPVYLVAFAMSVASLPLVVVGAAIGVLLVLYLLFEDLFSSFRATRARLRRLWSRPPIPVTPREERLEAVRES